MRGVCQGGERDLSASTPKGCCQLNAGLRCPQAKPAHTQSSDAPLLQVWLLSLGKTLGRQAPSFLRYGIDGRLLSALTPKDLAEVTGSRVGNAGQQALLAARDQ
jgi:hypothetical protein